MAVPFESEQIRAQAKQCSLDVTIMPPAMKPCPFEQALGDFQHCFWSNRALMPSGKNQPTAKSSENNHTKGNQYVKVSVLSRMDALVELKMDALVELKMDGCVD